MRAGRGGRSRGRGQGPEVPRAGRVSLTQRRVGLGLAALSCPRELPSPHPSSRRSLPGRWWPACCCCAPGPGALQLARDPCVDPLAQARGPASTCSSASCPLCISRTACPGEPGLPVPVARWDRPQPSHQSLTTLVLNPLPPPNSYLGRCPNAKSRNPSLENLLAQESQNFGIPYQNPPLLAQILSPVTQLPSRYRRVPHISS